MKIITIAPLFIASSIINQNITTLRTTINKWKLFKEEIEDPKLSDKLKNTKTRWNELTKTVEPKPDFGGIWFDPRTFDIFYAKFKDFLDHIDSIFRTLERHQIFNLTKYDEKLDDIMIIHRKNILNLEKYKFNVPLIYQNFLKIFNNLKKALNMAQKLYEELIKITPDHFQ